MPFHTTSVVDLIEGFRRHTFSPVDVTAALLARIEEFNDKHKAFITISHDLAKASASRAESAIRTGATEQSLLGVPYACKDVFCTRGLRTTGGSRVLEDWVPTVDAAAVERIANAGGVLLGKTNLHEFSYGATGVNAAFGTVPNPWDPTRIAGGSSTGSAVAVTCGLVPFALGTDSGGSVRGPAALCGIVGLKPTYGRISNFGTIPYAWSLDHVGILARTVMDAALVLEVLAGPDPRDSMSALVPAEKYSKSLTGTIAGIKIGVPDRFFREHVDREILSATQTALELAQAMGAKLVQVSMPEMQFARTVSLVIQMPEVLSFHMQFLPSKLNLYGEDVRSGLAVGQFILAEHYVRAKRMVTLFRRQMDEIFKRVDLLLTPSCPMIAPHLGAESVSIEGKEEAVGDAHSRFTSFFNLTGHPAISIPSGWHTDGLPMGIQIIARPFAESNLLNVAGALETALGIPSRQPVI